MNLIADLPIFLIAFAVSLSVHEFAHAWSSFKLGDDTAYHMGRLTLNPLAHISWTGMFVLVALVVMTNGRYAFGWAKPVPFNPNKFKNPKIGTGLTAIAGPISNILLVLILVALYKIFEVQVMENPGLFKFFRIFILLNVILAAFNMIPLPPLDGSKVIYSMLPRKFEYIYFAMERYGTPIFLVLWITGVLWKIIPWFILPIELLIRFLFGVSVGMFF